MFPHMLYQNYLLFECIWFTVFKLIYISGWCVLVNLIRLFPTTLSQITFGLIDEPTNCAEFCACDIICPYIRPKPTLCEMWVTVKWSNFWYYAKRSPIIRHPYNAKKIHTAYVVSLSASTTTSVICLPLIMENFGFAHLRCSSLVCKELR